VPPRSRHRRGITPRRERPSAAPRPQLRSPG
jgi:hypothetical protein